MFIAEILFWLVGGGAAAFFAIFAVTSFREGRPRATATSALSSGIIILIWLGWHFLFSHDPAPLLVPTGAALIFGLMFFLPAGRRATIEIHGPGERVDERDVIFAREEYLPGTDTYEAYYSRRPELKDIDDTIRKLPELLAPGGRYFDPIRSPYTESIFKVIKELTTEVDGDVAAKRHVVDPAIATPLIKKLARHLGADEVGIARLNPAFVYSHVGRGPEPWGRPIENSHPFAVAFTLEMAYDNVEAAPRLPITEESARAYLEGALISITLAQYIRDLGYPARAHIAGSNYQIMLPPVAHDAGLGELGRHGYLISPRYGARVRLGAVTTELPLITDEPISFGVRDFCDSCLRCAVNCPSGSIPNGGTVEVRGVRKWPLRIESCLQYWRVIGTDCGLCMKACPFSHPSSLVHNLIRTGIRRSRFARRVSIHGENLFYGKKVALPKSSTG